MEASDSIPRLALPGDNPIARSRSAVAQVSVQDDRQAANHDVIDIRVVEGGEDLADVEGHCGDGLHVAAVFAADFVEGVADLAEAVGLDCFHQRGEDVLAVTGGLLEGG